MDAVAMEVLDNPEIEQVESQGTESSAELSGENQESKQPVDPYSSKASREYSQWLKGLKEEKAADPAAEKFIRQSKDNHARLYSLQQTEPKGIEGVRETYALLDSVVHGDLKGKEAIGAIQDELRSITETDERIAAGDTAVVPALFEQFGEGLCKIAGEYLNQVQQKDPAAYSAAVLPHFVAALAQSELVQNHNALIDVLNEQPPKWLPADKLNDWREERNAKIASLVGKNSTWLNAQAAKVGELPKLGAVKPGTKEPSEADTLRKDAETQHWNTNIHPKLDAHADKKFDEMFRPYAKRLRLDKAAVTSLKQTFVQGVTKKSMANPAYKSQIQRYQSQSKPNADTVLNFARVEFDKHAKSVMEGIVNERYKPFLTGRTQPQPAKPGAKPAPQVGVQTVTTKPTNIDFKKTPLEWLHQKKYRLTDGKVVQLQR